MIKILGTADWHIGDFKGPMLDGVNLRAQDTINCLNYMIDIARVEHPEIVCVSGDIFHQEQVGPSRYSKEVIAAARIIKELASISKYVVVMRGTVNHDGNGQFEVLKEILSSEKNVSIVTEPTVIKTPLADIACLPGFDKQEFRAKFPGLSADDENITFITGWLERSQNSMPASRTPQAPAATKNMSTNQYMEATAGWCEGMGD